MIPTPARCLAMTVSAIALAGALIMAGVPGAVLLGLTPGLLCLAIHFAMGHGDPHGKPLLRTARMATSGKADRPIDHMDRAPYDTPQEYATK